MPTFVHPLLLWGLAIAAAPVLIHLINLLRRRRVSWAAMEFLQISQKKHRTWVIFRQLLLLLLRILAVAAVVLIVAQPLLDSRWSGFLGGRKTHHVLLVDDSYSMSDHWADTSAFAQAKHVVERIGAEAARQGPSTFTLLRFSQAAPPSPFLLGEGSEMTADGSENNPHPNPLPQGEGRIKWPTHPDFLRESADNGFSTKLDDVLRKIDVSQSGMGPVEPLLAIDELLGPASDERRIFYLISDFRQRHWNDPADVKKILARQQGAGVEIHLVNCVDRARPNLAIASLTPEIGIHAAGVSWFMEVSLTNFGVTPARDVPVFLEEDGRGRPAVHFNEIPPGRTARQRFLVNFPAPGWRRITARLEGDAVAVDNQRFYTVELPSDLPILLIDGDPRGSDTRFLNLLIASGGSARTGLQPTLETSAALSRKPLSEYAAINIANTDRLDTAALEALEKYVRDGGGVAFFLGEHCDENYYNRQLYRKGEGLFPLPLRGSTELITDRLETASDVQTGEHFLFRHFAKVRNNFLQSIIVQRYFAAQDGWKPPADGSVRVLARLRNGDPLIVEKRFGRRRVIAVLSSLAPVWNNWITNPGGALVLLELQGYLSLSRAEAYPRVVGQPLKAILDPTRYQPVVHFVVPPTAASGTSTTTAVDAVADAGGKQSAVLTDTGRSGFYEVRLTPRTGDPEIRRYAYNVDPSEGNLSIVDPMGLAERLKGIKYQYATATLFQTGENTPKGEQLRELILYLLIALLIGEQILAWSASYHPSTSRVGQGSNLPHVTAGGAS